MGTTKLTRKEIMTEDPVHESILQLWELLRVRGKIIAMGLGILAVLGIGIYFVLQYFESRDAQAQLQLARGIDYFHGNIDPSATDDPYGKGSTPTFRTEDARVQAAGKEFSSVISQYSYSKLAVIARYYNALIDLKLGRNKEALQSLESISSSSGNKTIGYLAKKVLAGAKLDAGNYKEAQEILDGMIKDSQCELPKEDLKLLLARTLSGQGKRDEAIKTLREALSPSSTGLLQAQLSEELAKLQQGSTGSNPEAVKPGTARP